MEVQQIEEKLKTALKPSRYRHTLGVAYTASCMAMVFGVDVHKAYRAGLLHDCAKGFSMEKQRALCKRYNISLEGTLTKSPQLMHQEIAPFLASDEYNEQDSEVLSAIACHTTGKIGMTPLEQIVFIADYMEPNRKMIPGLSKVRKLAFEDLDKCTKTILKNTIEYLTECGQEIDERTVETYKYYRDKRRIKMDQSLNMVKIAYDALDDKLAEDIKIIDIRSISVLADYFIIADGNNKNQVQAMVDNVQEELFKAGYEMKQMEGYREGNWILLDFGDIIIHIFDKENRLFYDLERIWKDGKEVSIEELN